MLPSCVSKSVEKLKFCASETITEMSTLIALIENVTRRERRGGEREKEESGRELRERKRRVGRN